MLVREHVARLNVCVFCMDIEKSSRRPLKAFMNEAKFDALERSQDELTLSSARKNA